MKKRRWINSLLLFVMFQFVALVPLFAGEFNVSDIALTPGQNATKLNIAWHTDSALEKCVVEIMKKHNKHDMYFPDRDRFPGHHKHPFRFFGTVEYAGLDENSIDTYSCEVTVSGLKESTKYVYRLGDNNGTWSDIYEYTTRDTKKFSFIYLADSQIGASAPRDGTPEEIAEAVANDTAGWVDTINIINTEFPHAAFILSGGDQTELPGEEAQWTGFFSAPELTSIPVAPTIGSHDDFPNGRGGAVEDTLPNFDYHFNLPNESADYGITAAGGDYYFTYGDVLYINLNMDPQLASYPMPPPPPPGTPPGPQECDPMATIDCSEHEAFIQEAIAANPHAKWRIVTWHYSIYSSGSHAADCVILALRDAMFPIIDSFDIDVVLMGHDHCFSRSYQMLGDEPQTDQIIGPNGEVIDPTGTLYFTANSSSGSKFYPIHADVDTFEYLATYSQLLVPSFSYVNIDKNRFSISTYRTDTMEMTDTYTIIKTKHKPRHWNKNHR